MSSDWNEPGGATWQEPSHPNWTQSPVNPSQHMEDNYPNHNLAFDPDEQGMLDTSFSSEQDLFPENQEMDEGEEGDMAEGLDPVAKSDGFLKQSWYYVTLIVFPLLFFGVASVLILPRIGTGHHNPLGFWFVAVVLLAIAVGQGVAVYFSGQENYMWGLGTVGGLILFALVGLFLVNLWVGLVVLVVILAGSVYLAQRSIHPVAEGSVDIVYVGGKYRRTLTPGFNFIWPWEAVSHRVNIEETHLMQDKLRIQLSRDEDVILGAVMSYQVAPEDAYLAITQVKDWEDSLRNLFVTTLQTVATHFVPTDFLAWSQNLQAYQAQTRPLQDDPENAYLSDESEDEFTGGVKRRERINTKIFHEMRDRVAPWGIQINWVRIRNIELAPHALAGVSAPATMSSYTAVVNDDETDKELIGVSNGAQTGRAQFVDQEITQPIGKSDVAQPLPPQDLPTEETLKKAYQTLAEGKITDPQTIRQTARTFEAVARSPEASQKMSFDVEHAAASLYKLADQYEEYYRSSGQG